MDVSYQNEINGLRASMQHDSDKDVSGSDLKRRTIVSASLYNLLPAVPLADHDALIKDMLFHQQWAVRDQVHLQLVDELIADGEQHCGAAQDKPTIFCSYHLGSYRLLIPYLVSKKIKFTLLIDSAVANLQRRDFDEVARRAAQWFGAPEDCCNIIDTAQGGVMFTMLRQLKQGRSLVVFIDGNSGVDAGRSGVDNRIAVDFFGQILDARKGVAYMSHMANVSMTPVVLSRDPGDLWKNHISFRAPVVPDAAEEKDAYARRAVQNLYHILEAAIASHPQQWESWFYVEQSLLLSKVEPEARPHDVNSLADDTCLAFDNARFSLTVPAENECLLFDRKHYRSTFISPAFMAFLAMFTAHPVRFANATTHAGSSESLIMKLLGNGVLCVRP